MAIKEKPKTGTSTASACNEACRDSSSVPARYCVKEGSGQGNGVIVKC